METPVQKRKFPTIIIGSLVLIAIAAGGWYWYNDWQNYVTTDDAGVDGFQSTISPKLLGKIQTLLVKENEVVKAGQLLVRLDDTNLKAQEYQAEAGMDSARKNVVLAEVNQANAQQDFDRAEAQFKEGYISKQDYDHSRNALDATRAQYAINRSLVDSAEAQLAFIETELHDTYIYAPINGVIAKRWALEGDVVQPSQPIFSIYDLKDIWITANLEETKLAGLKIGQPVEISVDTYPGNHFRGHIIEIGANTAAQFSLIPPNNASGNFTKITQRVPVKIAVTANPASKPLLPGMSVEIRVKVR
jgi:membrane fusion protein (multidrug efflux system)